MQVKKSRPLRQAQEPQKLTGKELERSFIEEEEIAGDHWIDRKVECYWAYPVSQRGFYPGFIKQVRRSDEVHVFGIQVLIAVRI